MANGWSWTQTAIHSGSITVGRAAKIWIQIKSSGREAWFLCWVGHLPVIDCAVVNHIRYWWRAREGNTTARAAEREWQWTITAFVDGKTRILLFLWLDLALSLLQHTSLWPPKWTNWWIGALQPGNDWLKKKTFLWMEVHSSTLLIFLFTFKIEDNLLCISALTANSELAQC